METERKNLLNPGEKPEKSYVEKCLEKRDGLIIAASDYMRTYADQIRPYLSNHFILLVQMVMAEVMEEKIKKIF